MRHSIFLHGLAALLWVGVSASAAETVVAEGKQVSVEYTLSLDDGTAVDSNVGQSPLVFVVGAGQALPAFETALLGLAVNESRNFELEPEEAYGPVKPEAFVEVDTAMVPEDARQVDARMIAEDDAGRRIPVRVHEVGEEKITLDYNHPLAGKKLSFDVKVVGIEEAPSQASETP